MNERERFRAVMHYEPRDRSPIMDFGFWKETLLLWQKEGLPEWVDKTNSDKCFGMDGLERFVLSSQRSVGYSENPGEEEGGSLGVKVGLYPSFESIVLEDRGDYEVLQQSDGVRVMRKKFMSSIPRHEGHLLVDRASWRKHYKPRLNPDNPGRFTGDWDASVRQWSRPERAYPLFLPGGSLYGWIRNWMGLEAVSYVVYDDPAWFEEMVETVADCIIETLRKILASGVLFDGCSMWEDMCFNGGPLLSPRHFERFLLPHYRRLTGVLKKYGVDVVWVDCDGDISQLIPLWLEGGVRCMMPVEVGTWGGDPIAYRRHFGKDLLLLGGFDKHILAKGKKEIEAEIQRLAPLVEEGGFIGFCDHRVPPDVPLANYLFYLQRVRHLWGRHTRFPPFPPDLENCLRLYSGMEQGLDENAGSVRD